MKTLPARRAALGEPGQKLIGLNSPEFGCMGIMLRDSGDASGAWYGANKPLAIPFTLQSPMIARKMFWFNGSAAGDSIDVGIYSPSWVRLVSAGSATITGNTAFQTADISDTPLPAGRYFAVMVISTTTANRIRLVTTTANALLLNCIGCYDSATDALALPDPLTNMVPAETATRMPLLWIEGRVV